MYDAILFISRHDPSKAGGGCYATRAYLESLIAIFPGKVTLLVDKGFEKTIIHGYEKLAHISYVGNRGRLQFLTDLFTFRYSKFTRCLSLHLRSKKFDLAILDNGVVGGTHVKRLKRDKTEVITIHHNNEVEYHKDNRTLDSLRGKFTTWVSRIQRRAYTSSHKNLFLTHADLQKFESLYGRLPSNHVIGCYEFFQDESSVPTVDYTHFNPTDIRLITTGTLSAVQTKESLYWFINHIYKHLDRGQLTVAGRNPEEQLIQFCASNRVAVVASPDDILTTIRQHDIYVCPVNLGGGLKLRIMDALKVGIICLIQEKSFRGYEELAAKGYVYSFKDNADFKRQLDKCVRQIENTPTLSAEIQQAYAGIFSFNAGVKRLQRIIFEH